MDRRLVFLFGTVLGVLGTIGATALYEAVSQSSDGWHWVDSVPVQVDRLEVMKAGWRNLVGAASDGAEAEAWGWLIELKNPTDDRWKGSLTVEVSLYDSEGLFLAKTREPGRSISVPPGQSVDASMRASASPRLLREAGQAVIKLRTSVSCPARVSYDSLVALIGDEAARERKEARVQRVRDDPALRGIEIDEGAWVRDAGYCYGSSRSHELTLRAAG